MHAFSKRTMGLTQVNREDQFYDALGHTIFKFLLSHGAQGSSKWILGLGKLNTTLQTRNYRHSSSKADRAHAGMEFTGKKKCI